MRISYSTIRLPLFVRAVALYALVSVPVVAIVTAPKPSYAPVSTPRPVTKTSLVKFETSNRVTGVPSQIVISRLGVILDVIDGEYDSATGSWTLTDDKAHFASMTELPNNEAGNTFIYGHNTAAVFAPLAQLQPGDEATIRTTNGKSFTYVFNGNQIVNPDTTAILASTESPRLTLMTCEGIFSEARRVATFDFKEVI